MREQKTRLQTVKSQVNTTGYSVQAAANQVVMGEAMTKTTVAMGTMNKQMNLPAMQKMASTYEAETAKMEMTSEASKQYVVACNALLVDDVYDSIFEGDEESEANIMGQIYDEIGLECMRAV